jgi:hypothetical protein
MSEDRVTMLQSIDVTRLTDVVRQDQRSPSFQIGDWSVRRLSDKGVINPDGLWLFSGQGHDRQGPRPWSVVLKILTRQPEEPPPSDLWYWKRELLLAQSGLAGRLPGPVKAPRFYESQETPDGAWIWMEHIQDARPGPWNLDTFAFAARQLGRWNGACARIIPLPVEPWLSRQPYHSWLLWMNIETCWQAPLNQKHISKELRGRHERLWSERESFYAGLESLPQVFSHFDSQRRNGFIRRGQEQKDELVLGDWAQCGLGPLGAELNNLIGASPMILEWPAGDVHKLEVAAFGSYLHGLREAGWSGEADAVRLGYTAWLAVYMGCIFPGWTAWWCAAEYRSYALQICGLAEEDLFWQLLPMLNYYMDCADEARRLMSKLGLK